MNKCSLKTLALTCRDEVAQFCQLNNALCNAHTVDFILKNQWEILPSKLREELSTLNMEQLNSLLAKETPEFLSERDFPEICDFIKEAKRHTLEAFQICTPMCNVLCSASPNKVFTTSNIMMKPKKIHEVEAMANIIAALASKHEISTVVDVGSGKGYLPTYLNLNHNLDVIGIDGSEGNTKSATERNTKLSVRFSKQKKIEKVNIIKTTEHFSSADKNCGENNFPGILISKTCTVTENTDFSSLINDLLTLKISEKQKIDSCRNFDVLNHQSCSDHKVILCGLHTCGNLSAYLLKHFVLTSAAKILCCVGCCYHLVEECFVENPFVAKGKPMPNEYGFPLSLHLIKCEYKLGRNARMLASQSVERFLMKKTVQNKSLFYRAVLEVVLSDHCKQESVDYRVGRLAEKCSGFAEYIHKALAKLNLSHINLTSSELQKYLDEYAAEEKRLYAFQLLRVILAPCVEALILLDRLVFLLEKDNVEEAYLTRLFDPVTSPRCYGLIAFKK